MYLDYDQFSKSVVLKTDRKYNPGDQVPFLKLLLFFLNLTLLLRFFFCKVYVSYGPKSNGELLVAYGMVPAGRNPHNSVDFQLGLSSDDPIFEKKLQILKQNGLTSYCFSPFLFLFPFFFSESFFLKTTKQPNEISRKNGRIASSAYLLCQAGSG